MDMEINFPNLGIYLDHVGKSISIFGFSIAYYGIVIVTGMMIAIWIAQREAKRTGQNPEQYLDLAMIGIAAGILGARIYYVIFAWDYYKDDLLSIFNIRQGGLAIYGGIIGGVITLLVVAKVKKIPAPVLLDLAGMGVIIGQCIGRWGNFMNREAFGAETTLPWRMQLTTTAGTLVEVHPTFLYESLWNVVGLLLIVFVVAKGRRFDGENTWFYFLWYGIGRFWVEGLRTDSLYLFNWTIGGEPIRVSQALSLVMVLVSAFMLLYNIKLHPHKPEELYVNIAAAQKAAEGESADGSAE